MCGRFALGIPSSRIMEYFGVPDIEERKELFRFNVAPTQTVPGVIRDSATGERRLEWFRWGLVPFWADDPKIGSRMINARAETIQQKPSFRQAFRNRRCLLPAQGFYEWSHREKDRTPWFIHRRDGQPMAFAGLWERWEHDTESLTSCTIITTAANETITPLHNRMPVILDRPDWDAWLDPSAGGDELTPLLHPAHPDMLDRHRVSRAVNNVRNDSPDCIAPLSQNR